MRLRNALVGTLAVCLLAACGSGGGDDGGEGGGDGNGDAKSDSTEEGPAGSDGGGEGEETGEGGLSAPATQLAVPALYDTSRGWELPLPDGDPLFLDRSGALAVLSGTGDVTVLDVATGETRWSAAPVATVSEEATRTALTLTVGDTDYLVVWSAGASGADAVSRGEDLTFVDIFAADGSGDAVEPLHHVEVPGQGEVTDGGAGLLVTLNDGPVVTVDPATGATAEYDPETLQPPAGCKECDPGGEIAAVTTGGPLVHDAWDYDGIWVPDAWSSDDIRPDDTDPENGPDVAWADNTWVVASWEREDEQTTWTVLDGGTGAIAATVVCADNSWGDSADHPRVSADGRYLVYGQRVFDLQEGTGHCFAETENTNPVELTAVTAAGRAFGLASVLDGYGETLPVLVDVATGEHEELSTPVFPVHDLAGMGAFRDEENAVLVFYAHAE